MPWVVSGRGEPALRAQARRLLERLAERPELGPVDVGFSLAGTRSAFEQRAVVLGGDREELLTGLRSLAEGAPGAGVVTGRAPPTAAWCSCSRVRGRSGWGWGVSCGMSRRCSGSRWWRASVRCRRMWAGRCGMWCSGMGRDPLWARVDVVQPVLWAVMVSLAAVWRSFGVEPAAVVGHSQGEVAAACVAGGLSLEDGARVVGVRSRLVLEKLSGQGGMVSVSLAVADAEERLARFDGRIGVAAVNGPSSVVVSGERDALDELLAECETDGVRARRIAVDYASHSAQVDALNDDLLTELADIRPVSSSVAFYSTVSGERVDTAGLDAAYWVRNLRQRVLFEPAVRASSRTGAVRYSWSQPASGAGDGCSGDR